ncbi:MAG: phosphoribosylglycinamide synthetase C domain-containing protein, partial [Planctomycetota bacterium]
LEYNVRFGDPECQPLMTLLDSDALELFYAAATGGLADADVRFTADDAVCIVLASEGYPEAPKTGVPIEGLNTDGTLAADIPGVTVYHAGTKRNAEGKIITNGGRVLSVTARAGTLREARQNAYAAVQTISFPGMQYRRDIAAAAAPAMS